jgi:uncharacterized membrane protein
MALLSSLRNRSQTAAGAGIILGVILLGVWLLETPAGLLGKADAIGYAVCHRIDLRSFHLEGRTLPLCARCTGTYLGVGVAFLAFGLVRGRTGLYPSRKILIPLGVFASLWVIDGINSALDLFPFANSVYPPSNTLRLMTGTFFGIALASVVYPGFHQAAWDSPLDEPPVRSWVDLIGLGVLGSLIILTVETENPLLLYPLALMSAGMVLVLLTMMYAILFMWWFKRENMAKRWFDLVPALTFGLALSILHIGVFNLIRYSIFQTWSGFIFS